MSVEKLTRIMKGDAGTYFDPELLGIFLERVVPRAVLPVPEPVPVAVFEPPSPDFRPEQLPDSTGQREDVDSI